MGEGTVLSARWPSKAVHSASVVQFFTEQYCRPLVLRFKLMLGETFADMGRSAVSSLDDWVLPVSCERLFRVTELRQGERKEGVCQLIPI